jgi:hypothetical protein
MRLTPDMEAIFPVKDAASAALMAIKADCLHKAGIITEWEERWVYSKVRSFLDDDSLTPPDRKSATPPLPSTLVNHRRRLRREG